MVVLCTIAVACVDESGAQTLTSGSSGRKFRQQAQQSVPYEVLNEETVSILKPVLDKPSLYRRLPVEAIQADPDYYRFLVRYPEVIVSIWKLMGVTKMDSERTGPFEVKTDDGAGTLSRLELVYGDQNKHIFYGEGSYEGPLLRRKLTGRCVLILNTVHEQDENGQPRAVSQLDVFLKVDNTTAGMIARTLQPIVGPTADHNFTESLKFVQRLNATTVKNGPGVQGMAEQLDISQEVRTLFQQSAGLTYQRALANQQARKPVVAAPANSLETPPASSQNSRSARKTPRNPISFWQR
jgi:hypothetical protein